MQVSFSFLPEYWPYFRDGVIYTLMLSFFTVVLAVLPAILLAIVVYAACVVLFKGVSYDDVAMLPKGESLARLLHMKPERAGRRAMPQEVAPAGGETPLEEQAPQAEISPEAPKRMEAKRSRGGKYVPRHMR